MAANFAVPMKQVVAVFEQKKGYEIKASFGSTGVPGSPSQSP